MPPNDPIVFIARHGQTSLNSSGRFRGNMDPVLTPQGIKEAHNLAKLFSKIDISHIFCSDKQRATKTAEIIAQEKGVPVHKSESLRALDVGRFSGQLRTPESEAELQQYLDSPDTTIPGGESLQEFKQRILPCLQEAVDLYCECGAPPLIVAHSSVVHEIGSITSNNHKAVLVEPGGVVAVHFSNGKLSAQPIFRPVKSSGKTHAETIT